MTMPDRFKVTKTEENEAAPDYLLEESCTGKLLNDLSDNGKFLYTHIYIYIYITTCVYRVHYISTIYFIQS